jgi:hypothetical protein
LLLGLPLDAVGDGAGERSPADREQDHELDERDPSCDERRGAPGSDEGVGSVEREIHRATRFARACFIPAEALFG